MVELFVPLEPHRKSETKIPDEIILNALDTLIRSNIFGYCEIFPYLLPQDNSDMAVNY